MGYVIAIGECCACRRPLLFNPRTVPSLRVRGTREPLCESCAQRWNALHPEQARAIAPDAYKPLDEFEV